MRLRAYATAALDDRIPVIALAASPFDHRSWEAVARLVTRVPFLVLTGPVEPVEKPSMHAHVSLIDDTLDALGIDHAVFAGSGLLGETVLHFAVTHPQRVAGLAVAGATGAAASLSDRSRWLEATITTMGDAGDPAVTEAIKSLAEDATSAVTRSKSALINLMNEWARTCDPREVGWILRAQSTRLDVREELAELTVPTTILRGDNDPHTSREAMSSLVEALCTVLHHVPGAGNILHFEQPARFAQAIESLLPFVCEGNAERNEAGRRP
ncbi:MAG: alpha/beta hydrolase [Actinomycetaceae bacterium]|nr:alpha/beta hydrolase [Actinomycetaceae bacterium]